VSEVEWWREPNRGHEVSGLLTDQNTNWLVGHSRLDISDGWNYNVITYYGGSDVNTIRTRFIQVGNSRGLRIPKVVIDQLGLGGEVEIAIQSDRLVIQSASRPRAGWDQEFRRMAEQGDDALLDRRQPTEWEKTGWEW